MKTDPGWEPIPGETPIDDVVSGTRVASAVDGLVAEVLGPVGGVDDLGGSPENAADVGGELLQGGDEGIGAGGRADLREAA